MLLNEQVTRMKILSGIKNPVIKEYFASGEVEKNWAGWDVRAQTFKDKVMSEVLQIMLDKNGIGEKDWSFTDEAKFLFEEWVQENVENFDKVVKEYENDGDRPQLCAEVCYSRFFKENNLMEEKGGDLLNEAKKSEFEKLKDNKIELTDEERKEVMDNDAVWHHGKDGAPSPAVWKSKDSKGKTVYVSNTHRMYQTARTLKACINKYHRYVKDSA